MKTKTEIKERIKTCERNRQDVCVFWKFGECSYKKENGGKCILEK